MRRMVAYFLLCIAVIGFFPYSSAEAAKKDEIVLIIEQPEEGIEQAETQEKSVRISVNDEIISCGIKEYLASVVLSEMPASFAFEALKAQAVAARTFLYRQMSAEKHENADICAEAACCQAWSSEETLQEKFGNSFDITWRKALQAVNETDKEVLTYDGKLIEATYFSCSGGSTEAAVAVWGSDVPYLQAVDSPGEEEAPKYETQETISEDRFQKILQNFGKSVDFSDAPATWIGDTTRTDGGGVENITLAGADFSGTEIRRLFGLNSAKFTLSYADGYFTFDVFGYGHRVGMSQYGANSMAKNGAGYEEILRHYYPGTEITKWQ